MASSGPHSSITSPPSGDPKPQASLDYELFQAVIANKTARAAELVQLGANPTASQKKGRTGTTNALLIAIQSISGEHAPSDMVSVLLKSPHVRSDSFVAFAPVHAYLWLTQCFNGL